MFTDSFKKHGIGGTVFTRSRNIEKLLKAYYVKVRNNNAPFTHDLLRVAEKAELDISEEQKDILDLITSFNIRARYDDYKMEFKKKCNKKFALDSIERIKGIRKWIKSKL